MVALILKVKGARKMRVPFPFPTWSKKSIEWLRLQSLLPVFKIGSKTSYGRRKKFYQLNLFAASVI